MTGRAAALFPLVGALIGALLGFFGLALDRALPAGPAAALLVAAAALLTGGLHLDGLMDTADGLAGGRSPEQRLAIMRDSRVGAIGAVAGGLALLAQFACLSELTGHHRLLTLVAAGALGRWAMLLAISAFPAAGAEGLGAGLRAGVTRGSAVAGSLLVLPVAVVAGPLGLAGVAVGVAVAAGLGRFLVRRLGGLTGDAYGAIAVVAETAVLFAAVALAPP
jgi:adenosylcobinamide-GDP ribazoletransferase